MSVEALICPYCGALLESAEVDKCNYCGANLEIPKRAREIKGAFRGIARNVQQRVEDSFTVLTFRVERLDSTGNILDYIQVELKDPKIRGTLVDGDEVEVEGEIDKEGILVPRRIRNLRTSSYITKASSGKGFILFLPPFILGALGFFIGSTTRSIGSIEGALTGFIAGCFLAVFIFIIIAVIKR